MLHLYHLAWGLLALASAAQAAYSVDLVYQFPNYLQWIENMAMRSNGNILITTFDHAHVYELDPNSGSEPKLIAQLPNADASIGIAEIAPDIFAVEAGYLNRSDYHLEGTGRIDILDFSCPLSNGLPKITTVASYPQASLPNGMDSLPLAPHILLSADSITGTIYRINTVTGHVEVAFQDKQLAPTPNPDPFLNLLGVNGLKVYKSYLYVTSSGGQFMGRYRIDAWGNPLSALEILVRYPTPRSPDDFVVAKNGTIFGAVPLTSVSRVAPDNEVTYIVDYDDELERPTSTTLSRDERTVYVSTGGRNEVGGKGGQIFAVRLE